VSAPRIVDAGPADAGARLAPLPPNAPRSGGNIFSRALGRTVFALGGWRTTGAWPDLRKVVVIVAPHSSVWDANWGLGPKVGLGLGLLLGHPLAMVLGLACLGLGYAGIVPIIFRRAAMAPGFASGIGLAAVGSVGYMGFLAGPPVWRQVCRKTPSPPGAWASTSAPTP